MKKLTEEMLGLSGFRYAIFDGWDTRSRLCFDNLNPLRNFNSFISLEICNKIHSEINLIVFDKTNNQEITKTYEKNN